MMLEQDILFVMDFCDTDMTVYNPKEEVLQMLRTLAASEGLFVWQLETMPVEPDDEGY